MQTQANTKHIQSIKYYNGLHPVIKALNKKNSRPTEFGHKVWASTLVLINFLSTNSFNLKNKFVLEVGCGWGILGLYLAKQFDCKVLCTDIDQAVLPIVQAHADLNSVSIITKAKGFTDISDSELIATQILAGVEVCYSSRATIELQNLVTRSDNFGVEQIFISDPGRPDFLDTLCQMKHSYNQTIYKLPGTKNGKVTHLLHLYKQ